MTAHHYMLRPMTEFLCSAAWTGDVKTVRSMLMANRELDVNSTNRRGQSALYCACRQGHFEVVHQLVLQQGIDLSSAQEPRNDSTPLHAAGFEGHLGVVCMLLYCGADPTVRNSLGLLAIDEAKPNVKTLMNKYQLEGISVLEAHIPKNIRKKLHCGAISANGAATYRTLDREHQEGTATALDQAMNLVSSQKLWLIAMHKDWIVDIPTDTLVEPTPIMFEYVFTQSFYENKTAEFIVRDEEKNVCGIISVCTKPDEPFPPPVTFSKKFAPPLSYSCLYIHSTGYDTMKVTLPVKSSHSIESQLTHYFHSILLKKSTVLEKVKVSAMTQLKLSLKKFELKHSRRVTAFKVAILYAKPNQSMAEIWENRPAPDHRFYKFLNTIATPVDFQNWDGFRGDMGTGGADAETLVYHRLWKGIDIIFHLAPAMESEQHRRLCGNDISVLIYFDRDGQEDAQFMPFGAGDMGAVPHVFCVVSEVSKPPVRVPPRSFSDPPPVSIVLPSPGRISAMTASRSKSVTPSTGLPRDDVETKKSPSSPGVSLRSLKLGRTKSHSHSNSHSRSHSRSNSRSRRRRTSSRGDSDKGKSPRRSHHGDKDNKGAGRSQDSEEGSLHAESTPSSILKSPKLPHEDPSISTESSPVIFNKEVSDLAVRLKGSQKSQELPSPKVALHSTTSVGDGEILFDINNFGEEKSELASLLTSITSEKCEEGSEFLLAQFRRPSVKPFVPGCPPLGHKFTPGADFENYLYTSLYNGMIHAQASPPLNRLFIIPRRAALQQVGDEHADLLDRLKRQKTDDDLISTALSATAVSFLKKKGRKSHQADGKEKKEREKEKEREKQEAKEKKRVTFGPKVTSKPKKES
eukprot:TRINITY_DN153_c2_g1_i1.p1 TRINITY_DN153_c2_g1~~TRINITY_DN153_c2_g1_i1.p1  ORF type:complete len:858 (-),score=165.97 TRINITY_DN153_c2_g1_i1:14-2587(-)